VTQLSHHLSHTISLTQLCHSNFVTIFHWAASVALGDIHLHFARQAWHLLTSTFVSRGTRRRRGTWGTGLALVARLVAQGAAPLCVAGVALGDIHLRFVWQA